MNDKRFTLLLIMQRAFSNPPISCFMKMDAFLLAVFEERGYFLSRFGAE
jgi:hypothetical protein